MDKPDNPQKVSDSVLRCLVAVKCNEQVSEQVFDAVRNAGDFLIVLEWGSQEERDGCSPRQYVTVPNSEIEFEADLSKEYELFSRTGIDFDLATVTDIPQPADSRFYVPPPLD